MISILIGVLLFVAVLWWDVQSDYRRWVNNVPINHKKEMVTRCLLLTPSAFFLVLGNFSLFIIPIVILMQGAWWWEFFDGWYNTKRGFRWRYNGSIDPDDSKLDSFLYGLSDKEEFILKWGLIIISTTLYIIT